MNEAIIAVVLSFLAAQGLKVLLDWRRGKPVRVLENGGMPSSHSATVIALATVVYLEQGVSLLFLAVVVYAVITMNDAVGVRRETSKHSVYLNKQNKKNSFKIVGHEPREVLVGALIGLIIPLVAYVL